MNKYIDIDDDNYYLVHIGSKVSYPNAKDDYCLIEDIAGLDTNYAGQWTGFWKNNITKNKEFQCFYDLSHFKQHKYYLILNKSTVII